MKLKTKTVSELNKYISSRLETDVILKHLAVKGEISNLSGRQSTHVFFNLIDGESQISCVMFKDVADKFRDMLINGASLIVFGSIQVYSKLGKYQINVNNVVEDEATYLNKLFLEMKEKLFKLGYFEESRKKKLPKKIGRIGLVCSKTSAAIVDFLTVLKSRNPLIEVLLLDVHVQGEQSINEVSCAIREFQNYDIDLIVVTRGGGSAEDLFVFNDEQICKAAFESSIPVLSAIGHERDTCLLDFTADIVAGTPSIAAQMISEDFFMSIKEAAYSIEKIENAVNSKLKLERIQLESGHRSLIESSDRIIEYRKFELKNIIEMMFSKINTRIRMETVDLKNMLNLLKSYDISNVLARGFSILWQQDKLLDSAKKIKIGDIIGIQTKDYFIDAEVKAIKKTEKNNCNNVFDLGGVDE